MKKQLAYKNSALYFERANIAQIAKKINPKVTVILGGNHISNQVSDYEHALKNPGSNLPETISEMDDKNIWKYFIKSRKNIWNE